MDASFFIEFLNLLDKHKPSSPFSFIILVIQIFILVLIIRVIANLTKDLGKKISTGVIDFFTEVLKKLFNRK